LKLGGTGERSAVRKIFTKRNALIGSATVFFAKRYAKKRLRRRMA